MFRKIFKRTVKTEIYSIISGKLIKMSEIKDTTFNQGFLGLTVGILPSDYSVYSPFDCEITMIFKTKHAIGLKREDGLEVLIHIGIETVQLNGEGFSVKVKEGDIVRKGDLLVEFDNEVLQKHNLDNTVIVIFTNAKAFNMTLYENKNYVKVGEIIANAKRKPNV